MTRREVIAGGAALAAAPLAAGAARAQPVGSGLTRAIYEGFARNEPDRWDPFVRPDVIMNSSGAWDVRGLPAIKTWAAGFHTAFRPKVDLVDEFAAGDRAWVTVNLHWRHAYGDFLGIKPTGRAGTSIEVFVLRLDEVGRVHTWNVADNTLDLAGYLMEQGMKVPTNIVPPALVKG